ncbi:hotdog fold thioesterase [Dinghuibacter silviterrae]|uniref:1,4-dihydroxy-2-naphthoyl-CoA hydrolase n=1 Tax=Dinghuibacter silviterrae TaxID=1539049 RepID=A0A4V3GKU8_9BACT|nr:hotdog fold thioesterase [Dinghuibacter silviterrae]TDW97022.1 1,4-dihydroxy-2-naphthoyl-CoA hydrolase [Dinghuibacter silviterrae]
MPSIWLNPGVTIADIQPLSDRTMAGHLGILFTEIGNNFLTGTMPVDHRTHQPAGLLHGGASCVLAETLGSVASYLVIDPTQAQPVGLEINANHIRGVRSGLVTGTATSIHLGKTTHVWDIRIRDEGGHLVCISRLTVAIIRPQKP